MIFRYLDFSARLLEIFDDGSLARRALYDSLPPAFSVSRLAAQERWMCVILRDRSLLRFVWTFSSRFLRLFSARCLSLKELLFVSPECSC